MRLILAATSGGCVGFRIGSDEIKLDSFYLERRFHNTAWARRS
jgi:hypothetical protein